MEFLALGIMKGNVAGSIICLVGPPGLGKTTLGRSIAQALNHKFYRFSVGGMRDQAEIKGHRRTYIAALSGKLIQALRDAEVANPVVMLDEIDKIATANQRDFEEVPQHIRQGIQVHFADTFDDVVALTLRRPPRK